MTARPYIVGLRRKIGADLRLVSSVAAVIHDDQGRLLLQSKAGAEGWSLPAEGIAPGETPQESLHREVLEETGGSIETADLVADLGGAAFRYRYPNGYWVEYTVVVFRCSVTSQDFAPTVSETEALCYFSEDDHPVLKQPYPKSLLF